MLSPLAVPAAARAPSGLWLLRSVAFALLGSLLLAIAAHIAVPFWPVPITLQTLAVMALGALLGPRVGAGAVLAYAAEGMAGLPVFAQGAGLAVLAGPTGGYIVGFLPAAILAGVATRRGWLAKPLGAFAAFFAADALIFVFGVAWLTALIGWEKAVVGGLVPFLLGEALKLALATALAQVCFRRRRP